MFVRKRGPSSMQKVEPSCRKNARDAGLGTTSNRRPQCFRTIRTFPTSAHRHDALSPRGPAAGSAPVPLCRGPDRHRRHGTLLTEIPALRFPSACGPHLPISGARGTRGADAPNRGGSIASPGPETPRSMSRRRSDHRAHFAAVTPRRRTGRGARADFRS